MKPRKFFGSNSRDVLKQVREALGPDALILSNAKVAGGIEVIALPSNSINDIVIGAASAPASPAAGGHDAGIAREPAQRRVEHETAPRRELAYAANAVEDAAQRREPSVAKPPEPVAPVRQEPPAAAVAPAERSNDALVMSMLSELRGMRSVLEQRLAGLAWSDLSRRDPAKAAALQALLTAGFSAEAARRLTDPMPDDTDEQEGTKWLIGEINRNLITASQDNDIVECGGVYAIVGPTGVGKTTTTAKLAARAVVRHGADRVALLTTDTYRIGAHEQLRIYGRILGVATSIVRDSAELKSALSDLRGKHMVLIDTVGMSQRDKMLAEQISALGQSGGNVKRLLLLNATCNGETLEDVVRCYQPTNLDGCIITKLDEAQSIGAAMDVLIRHRLALHFVANGQRVPEDLHTPNRQYLIHRALRTVGAESPFGLAGEEYSLLLGASRRPLDAPTAYQGAERAGAYLG
jgi:flagellar biosynthesis protein FlhF